jgi:hypothetical protein
MRPSLKKAAPVAITYSAEAIWIVARTGAQPESRLGLGLVVLFENRMVLFPPFN